MNDTARLVVPAGDIENEEVEHDLRPDVAPPPSATETGEGSVMKPEEKGAAGEVDNEEVWRDLRPDVTPPDAATGK